jgi:hypothetical protein
VDTSQQVDRTSSGTSFASPSAGGKPDLASALAVALNQRKGKVSKSGMSLCDDVNVDDEDDGEEW